MSDDLVNQIRAAVQEVVQEELRKFRDAEIVPLQQQIHDLTTVAASAAAASNAKPEPPATQISALSLQTSLQNTPPVTPQTLPSLPSSLPSPLPSSPGFLHRVSSKVLQSTSALFSLDDPSNVEENTGPITIRRNSGLSRVVEQSQSSLADYSVPRLLLDGVSIIRITHNKKVQRLLKLDASLGTLTWNTKQTSKLYIDRICEIYIGEEARNYREEFGVSYEHSERWATIIHQRLNETKLRALHLVISSKHDFDVFLKAIVELVKFRRELMCGLARAGSHFIDVHWKRTNMDTIGFHQVLQMTRQMHIHCSAQHIRQVFELADLDNSGKLNFVEFKEFVRLLKHRADINDIYNEYKIGESTSNLISFFTNVQKEPQLPSTVNLPLTQPLSLDEFSKLLLPVKPQFSVNLNQPLNNYFISSSHNTYLSGRQIADGSSVESCIRALQDGCRCLELDCWDGPEKRGSPVVYHGNSVGRLTSSLVFSDVVESILKYAFISSPYPLILSLEIRCNETSQLQIVSILKSVFGSLLVTEPLFPNSRTLPSPEQLKHKILVKVKSVDDQDGAESSESNEFNEGSDSSVISMNLRPERQKHKIVPPLAELGVYFSGKKFESFDVPVKYNTVYSFSERSVRKMTPQRQHAFEKYNRDHLSRVYPAAMRISSSNFDPIYFWKKGVQMVALNWQKWDLGMQLNSAFFPSKVGYALKPKFIRSPSTSNGTGAEIGAEIGTVGTVGTVGADTSAVVTDGGTDIDDSADYAVKIRVISAQQLTRPKFLSEDDIFSPYVIVQAFGLEDLDTQLAPQWRTISVFNNGFNPTWNYDFELKINPADFEFVCFRFSLATDSRIFAHCTTRAATMPLGYRHFPLQDLYGEDYIFSALFIKTSIDRIQHT